MEPAPELEVSPVSLVSYARLLRGNGNFRRLWSAQVVSEIGDWFYTLAIYNLLLQFTGRAGSVALALVLQVLPQTLIGPTSGVVNDRLRRKRVMIAADLGRMVIVFCMLLVRSRDMVWLVYPLLVAETLLAAFFEPAGVNSLLAGVGPADVQNHDPRKVPLVFAGAPVVGNGVLACAEQEQAVFCQLEPWQFAGSDQPNLRRTYRRVAFLVMRLLANLGVASDTPLLERFHRPVATGQTEQRWREGFYVDQPEEWDDPYRFFRW